MQFNSHASNFDIVSDTKYWCGIPTTDSTKYPIADITRNANLALDRVVSLIQESDNIWEWDDQNETDLPIAKTTLVAEQQDYGLAVTHLKIHRVRIKDSAGEWVTLTPINRRDLTDAKLTQTSGTPLQYDKMGNSVFLYPKPSATGVTLASGLEIQFQRGASYFTTSDTTKTPGFASPFHRLVSLYAALDYCEANGLERRITRIQGRIATLEEKLVTFYTQRSPDTKNTMELEDEDYGQSLLERDGQFGSHPDKFIF